MLDAEARGNGTVEPAWKFALLPRRPDIRSVPSARVPGMIARGSSRRPWQRWRGGAAAAAVSAAANPRPFP